MSLRNFGRALAAAALVAGLDAGPPAFARAQDAAGAVRERLNRVGSDLFSPTPHPAEAIQELKAILAVAPDSPEAHMLLGIAYRAQGTPELMSEAVAELRQALSLNPDLNQARLILARVYLDLARAERARDELQVALQRMPDDLQLLTMLAEAERQLGNPKRAVEVSRQVLAANRNFDQARYYLGLALLDLRQPADAVRELEVVAQSGASPAETSLALGTAYLEAGRAREALGVLRTAVELDANSPEPHVRLARAYRLNGRLTDAAREIELARASAVASLAALYALIPARARSVETALELEDGLLNLQRGRIEAAAAAFERVLAVDATHEEAKRRLAETRRRLQHGQKKQPGEPR